jgi:hypothetical protein
MAKPDLRQALSAKPATPTAPTIAVPAETANDKPRAKNRQASRVGKKFVGGRYDKAVHKQITILAAEQERKMEDLVGEALNDLFAKYRKPELVTLKTHQEIA